VKIGDQITLEFSLRYFSIWAKLRIDGFQQKKFQISIHIAVQMHFLSWRILFWQGLGLWFCVGSCIVSFGQDKRLRLWGSRRDSSHPRLAWRKVGERRKEIWSDGIAETMLSFLQTDNLTLEVTSDHQNRGFLIHPLLY
jgi:hypothetical protein